LDPDPDPYWPPPSSSGSGSGSVKNEYGSTTLVADPHHVDHVDADPDHVDAEPDPDIYLDAGLGIRF
jgi:hypothetical protein